MTVWFSFGLMHLEQLVETFLLSSPLLYYTVTTPGACLPESHAQLKNEYGALLLHCTKGREPSIRTTAL